MSDYGISISESSTPISRATDYQKVIDTRWKTTSIVSITPINIPDAFSSVVAIKLVDHNLGYIPAFEAPYYNTRFETGLSHTGGYLFIADRSSIYFITSPDQTLESGYTIVGNIIVYDINMEVDYVSELSGSATAATSKSNRGMKIIGNDQYAARDASDTNPLGFSFTTDSKAIGIDRIGTVNITGGDSVGFTVLGRGVINHKLSYPPLVKTARIFSNTTNGIIIVGSQTFQSPSNSITFYSQLQLTYAKIESQAVILQSFTNDTYRYILFKEPTEIAG